MIPNAAPFAGSFPQFICITHHVDDLSSQANMAKLGVFKNIHATNQHMYYQLNGNVKQMRQRYLHLACEFWIFVPKQNRPHHHPFAKQSCHPF